MLCCGGWSGRLGPASVGIGVVEKTVGGSCVTGAGPLVRKVQPTPLPSLLLILDRALDILLLSQIHRNGVVVAHHIECHPAFVTDHQCFDAVDSMDRLTLLLDGQDPGTRSSSCIGRERVC